MSDSGLASFFFLSRGGEAPRVEVYDPLHLQFEKIFEMETLGTPYVVASPSSDGRLVVGTKEGFLYLMEHDGEEFGGRRVNQEKRSSFLAACWVGEDEFVTSEIGGTLCWWRVDSGEGLPSFTLHVSCEVCSLVNGEGDLYGYSAEGKITRFPNGGWENSESIPVTSPASPLGLVEGFYYAPWGQVLFPADKGTLVLVNPVGFTANEIQAHEQGPVVVTEIENRLFTIGTNDGLLKEWEKGKGECLDCWTVCKGVISAFQLPLPEPSLVLVRKSGQALVVGLDDGRWTRVMDLGTGHYRKVLGVGGEQCGRVRANHKARLANRIISDLKSRHRSCTPAEVKPLLDQLDRLGNSPAALEFEGFLAQRDGNLVEEIVARSALISLLDPSQIHSSIVERYCRALMQLGLFRLAAQELERFIGVTEKSRLRGLLGDLEHVVDAMDRDATVFLPERGVDPKQILLAASRLGIPFTARIAKKALTRISVDEVSASLHPLLDRLRRNPTLSNHQSTILHDPMPMTWINAGGQMESNDGVVIESSDPSMPGLEILVTFRDIQMQKFIEPWIVFRPSPSEKGVGLDACNKQSLDWLRQLESSEGRDVWLKKVDEILRTEIRTWEGVTRTVKRREQQLERITK